MSIKTGLEYVGCIDPWTDEERLSDEEIVRCRDCKRVTIDQGDHDYREPLWCGLFRTDVRLDGFCAWGERKEDAEGGAAPESYIRSDEEGSICPAPRTSVIFEGQKFTFDAAESEVFTRLLKAHFRRLAGLGVDV